MNYTTTFPATENPIDQGSKWTNGDAVGLDWCNVRTTGGTPGLAYGTQDGNGYYDDSIAILSDAFAADQMAYATVYKNSPGGTEAEVEILLRFNISANSTTGYECQFSLGTEKRLQIVEWLGPYGAEHTGWEVRAATTGANVINDGDVVKGIIVGTLVVMYVNGVEVLRYASASNIASGHPGIGFYQAGATNANFGFKGFTATDSLPLFFGAVDAVGVASGSANNNDVGILFWRAYTCPGSGEKAATVFQEMSHGYTTDCGARLGIYNASGDTRLWDSGQFNVPVNGGVDQWVGPASLAGAPALTGGTDYILAWCSQNNGQGGITSTHVDDSRSAGSYYIYINHSLDYYTNGLPASIAALTPDGTHIMYPMRVGVEGAGGEWEPQTDAPEKLMTIATPRWRS